MRLDFVFQDMNFELDVNPLSAFNHLHTLDLNFYDNHRFLYTGSIWISWANFLNLEQEHDCTKTSNVLFQMKIQVQIWNQLQHQIMTQFRNPLFDKILKTCGTQIKTLIYNVFADYRSIVDCHNIIAK